MTRNPKMSKKLKNGAEFEEGVREELSECCSYQVANISDTKEDKVFCMNCGWPCLIKKTNIKPYVRTFRTLRSAITVRSEVNS